MYLMSTIIHLYKRHIKGTERKSIVRSVSVLLCHLTVAVIRGVEIPCNKVYVSTRVIKHIYDKRPAEEFDFVMDSIESVMKYPDKIYRNKEGKKAEFCFVKNIKNSKVFAVLEVYDVEDFPRCEVVTFYRVEEKYLKNYELLWEWEGGTPPS